MKQKSQGILFTIVVILFLITILLITKPAITGAAVQSIETYDLDFTQVNYEYEVNVIAGSVLNIIFPNTPYHLNVEKVSNPITVISGVGIRIGESTAYDLDKNEEDDIVIQFEKIDKDVATLKIYAPEKFNLLELIFNFWWLILLVIILITAVILFYKTEYFRTKNTRKVLDRLEKSHKAGIINESLYNKARRAIKKKLKP